MLASFAKLAYSSCLSPNGRFHYRKSTKCASALDSVCLPWPILPVLTVEAKRRGC